MKLKNIAVMVSVILYFTSLSTISSAKDCGDYKILSHKWLMCSAGKDEVKNADPNESDSAKNEEAKEVKLDDVKSSIGGFFKKIKNFGGKNIGEEG